MKAGIFIQKFNNNPKPLLKLVKKILQNLNIEVDDSYFDQTCEQDKKDLKNLYKRVGKILKDSDVLIVDMTGVSRGMAFVIGLAIAAKKPVLVLYSRKSRRPPSLLVKAYTYYSKYFYEEYYEDMLEEIITSFIIKSKKHLGTPHFITTDPIENRLVRR